MAIEEGKGLHLGVEIDTKGVDKAIKGTSAEFQKLVKQAEQLKIEQKQILAEIEQIQKSYGITADVLETISKYGEDDLLRLSEQEQHVAALSKRYNECADAIAQVEQRAKSISDALDNLGQGGDSMPLDGVVESAEAAQEAIEEVVETTESIPADSPISETMDKAAESAEAVSEAVDVVSEKIENIPSIDMGDEELTEFKTKAEAIRAEITQIEAEEEKVSLQIKEQTARYKEQLEAVANIEKFGKSEGYDSVPAFNAALEEERRKAETMKASVDALIQKEEQLKAKHEELRRELEQTVNINVTTDTSGVEQASQSFEQIGESVDRTGKKIEHMTAQQFKKLRDEMNNTGTKGATVFDKLGKRIEAFGKRIRRMAERFIVMRIFTGIFNSLKNGLELASKNSDTLADKFMLLKQRALIAFYPAIEKASQVLEKLCDWAIKATDYIGAFIRIMTGTSLKDATKGAETLWNKVNEVTAIDNQIAENKRKIKELERQIKEENRLYKEQKKAIDGQKDTLNDQIKAIRRNINHLRDAQNEKKRLYDDEKQALQDSIEAINDRIKALQREQKEQNRVYEAQKKAIEAEIQLLKREKEAREDAIREAKNAADEKIKATNAEIKAIDKEIKALEKQLKETQEAAKAEEGTLASFDTLHKLDAGEEEDPEVKAIEEQIEALEEKKDALDEIKDAQEEERDNIPDAQDDPIVKQIEERIRAYEDEKDRIEAVKSASDDRFEDEIDANRQLIESLNDQIDLLEKEHEATDRAFEAQIEAQEKLIEGLEDKIEKLDETLETLEEEHEIKVTGLEDAKLKIETTNGKLTEMKNKIKEAGKGFGEFAGNVDEGADEAEKSVGGFVEWFDTAWDKVNEGLSKFSKKFWEAFDKADEWWYEHVDVPIHDFFFVSIPETFKTFYHDIIEPLFVEPFLRGIADIKQAVYRIKKWWFDTALPFIKSIFTKEFWTEKWDAIKKGAKAAFNGVIGVVERAINFIIEKLNTISWEIPDYVPLVGGKTFGFNLKPIEIPRLAQGAVIPGGAPFLAILGDQPSGKRNLEVPEELLRKIYREEMANSTMNVEVTNVFEGNLNQFARVIEPYVEVATKRKSAFA